MNIPDSRRKKALILIDIQHIFLKRKSVKKNMICNVQKVLSKVPYDMYIEAVFFADKNSLWQQQTNWCAPRDKQTTTINKVAMLLKDKHVVSLMKSTKSAFKGNKDIKNILHKKRIKELHIVGVDTNDRVLATAYEAFDLGFFTYVLEECTASSGSSLLHKNALSLLRYVNLTNNSCVEKIRMKKIT